MNQDCSMHEVLALTCLGLSYQISNNGRVLWKVSDKICFLPLIRFLFLVIWIFFLVTRKTKLSQMHAFDKIKQTIYRELALQSYWMVGHRHSLVTCLCSNHGSQTVLNRPCSVWAESHTLLLWANVLSVETQQFHLYLVSILYYIPPSCTSWARPLPFAAVLLATLQYQP